MRSIIENQFQLLVVVVLAVSSGGVAQVRTMITDSGTPRVESCDTIVAERLDRVRKINRATPKRILFPLNQKLKSRAVSEFLNDVEVGELFAYGVKGPKETALIISTTRVGKPLSEDSIQDWFIQVGESAVRFRSIATNPNLIFWDKEGRLNYITLSYSDGVAIDASPNIVSLDFRRMQLRASGVTELIEEEKNVRCVVNVRRPQ
jgi:hypothetical protein